MIEITPPDREFSFPHEMNMHEVNESDVCVLEEKEDERTAGEVER